MTSLKEKNKRWDERIRLSKKKTINSKKGLVIFFKFQDWIKSRKVNNTKTEYPLTEFSDLIEFLSILNFISQRG